jgi:hypothetical protein
MILHADRLLPRYLAARLPLIAAAAGGQVCMAIATYLDDFDADLETKRVLRIALDGLIARRIVELAKAGERDPDLLCEGAVENLREHLYGD